MTNFCYKIFIMCQRKIRCKKILTNDSINKQLWQENDSKCTLTTPQLALTAGAVVPHAVVVARPLRLLLVLAYQSKFEVADCIFVGHWQTIGRVVALYLCQLPLPCSEIHAINVPQIRKNISMFFLYSHPH